MVSRLTAADPRAQEAVTCILGLSDDCLRQELQESRRLNGELEGRMASLAELETRYQNFVLFADRPLPGHPQSEVTTGVRYRSILADSWENAWCNVETNDAGVSRIVTIARASPASGTRPTKPTATALGEIGMTAEDITKARALCEFPAA